MEVHTSRSYHNIYSPQVAADSILPESSTNITDGFGALPCGPSLSCGCYLHDVHSCKLSYYSGISL
jgi:hypothetical protein